MRRATLPPIRACALLLACGLVVGMARAEPELDPVTRLLTERGLIDAASTATPSDPADTRLRTQVREAASDMVVSAMNFLGVPYKRGGNSADTGFDCSGFTRHVFENSLGLVLPRRADEQAKAPGLLEVRRDELKPGDLVFFNTLRQTFSHVGIYIGEGKFIHSPRSGGKVRIEDMRFDYWAKRFTGARRAGDEPGNVSLAPEASLSPTALSAASLSPGLIEASPPDVPVATRAKTPRAKATQNKATRSKAVRKKAARRPQR